MKICDDSVRAAIDSGLSSVQLDAAQKQVILAQCRPAAARARAAKPLRRVLALAASFALVLCLGGGVLAAAPGLRQTLAMLGEETLRLLQPVNQSSRCEGIRMEVLAAMNDGQVAAVYLTLQDTTGQGRITADSQAYTAQVSGAGFTSGQVVDYDEATGTAVLCLTAQAGQQLDGETFTVTTSSILSGEHYAQLDPGYTVAQLQKDAGQVGVQYGRPVSGVLSGGPAMHEYSQMVSDGKMASLLPFEESLALPGIDWASVTAAGVVDGQVHIQVSRQGEMAAVNSIGFSLRDESGRRVECTALELELGAQHELGAMQSYNDLVEYVLIPPKGADPETLYLQADTVTYDHFIQGDWSVTFALEQAQETVQVGCDVAMDPWRLTNIQISPIAVTVTGQGKMENWGWGADVEVYLKDGTQALNSASSTAIDEDSIVCTSVFNQVIDPEDVAYVVLNGETVPVP